MKSFQSLIVALLAIIVISTPVVAESSTQLRTQQQPQLESQDERKLFFGLGHLLPHPHPKPTPSSDSSSDGSSGSSGSGSGSSGSSSGGSSGGSSGSGGSSSGGSSSGGSSSGGSSSGGSSGVDSSTSGTVAGAQSSDTLSIDKGKKSLALMLSIAAVAGMAIAAVAIPRRKVATEDSHALKGSLNKRIELFSNLAKHASSRPPRRDEEGRYINADAIV
eukprot:CAMPEP_0116103534 /NCGR_PEP_ID=MMETSP0327-20121206/13935_1 /TAXON_ID=44447 /ORGANISM="Pseudo-nitzschia delicatissima, Strain B596" /LENGTH=218 /DNA_ID=CAMNT_0003595649 /DNA_START=135 /DNA_END=791 /DNA_ORIENTATION=-